MMLMLVTKAAMLNSSGDDNGCCRDQDGFMMERYRLKWAARLCDLEVKDTAMTLDMCSVLKMDSTRLNILTAQLGECGDSSAGQPHL